MAINKQVDPSTIAAIEQITGGTTGKSQTLVDSLVGLANQSLMSNTNYLNTLLQIQQSSANLQQNTDALQKNINSTSDQMSDAQYESNQQQATSGVGNTGLGALKAVNSKSNAANTLADIQNTAASNRTTRETLDLRNASIQQSLLQNMATILNQNIKEQAGDNAKDITIKDINGNDQTFSKDEYQPIWGSTIGQTTDGMDPISEDDRKKAAAFA